MEETICQLEANKYFPTQANKNENYDKKEVIQFCFK